MVETVTFSIFHRAQRGHDSVQPAAALPPVPVPPTLNPGVEARRRAAETILGRRPAPARLPVAAEPSVPPRAFARPEPQRPTPPAALLGPAAIAATPIAPAGWEPAPWAPEMLPEAFTPVIDAPAQLERDLPEEPAAPAVEPDLAQAEGDRHAEASTPHEIDAAPEQEPALTLEPEPEPEPEPQPQPHGAVEPIIHATAAPALEPDDADEVEPEPGAPWIEHVPAPEPVSAAAHHNGHEPRASPAPQHDFGGFSLEVEAQLLGLANPTVCTVIGTVGDAPPVLLSLGRTGIYRPVDFRPAPWSGFAYEAPEDRRSGLMSGTRVLTARGEYPVEDLMPGDSVLTLRGPALLPIIWIGRSVSAEAIICIEAGALGPGRPRNQLLVGGEQAVFIDAKPIRAHDLVNGRDIRVSELGNPEMFHVDVGSAEVILAEAVPVASARR